MRFLIHEMKFERLLAAGQLAYREGIHPTGATEAWRLTQAADGYRFLRVDLDYRPVNGASYLYHLTLTDEGQPERLNFRHWRPSLQVQGNVLLERDGAIVHREVNGQRFEETVDSPLSFYFPSILGMAQMLARLGPPGPSPQKLEIWTLEAEEDLALRQVSLVIGAKEEESLVVGRHTVPARPYSIAVADEYRTVWLDRHGLPLRMTIPEEATATETRYIRYLHTEKEE